MTPHSSAEPSWVPTISFRDITIQRREDDLVAGSFGRGIFILDDITPLRNFDGSIMDAEATMFPTKDALWYTQFSKVSSQGYAQYKAKNRPYGARFTYYMADKVKSMKEERKANADENAGFEGWDTLEAEKNQDGPAILLIIKDADGNIVNTIKGSNKKGFNRVNWELNYPNKGGEHLNGRGDGIGTGYIKVTPGTYSVTLVKRVDGVTTVLEGPQNFNVVPVYDGALPRKSYDVMNQFREEVFAFQQDISAANLTLSNMMDKVGAMKRAANKTTAPNDALLADINQVRLDLLAIQKELQGDPIKGEIGERSNPTPNDGNRLGWSAFGNTYGPTGNHKGALTRAKNQLQQVKAKISGVMNRMPGIERRLQQAGAPWIEGQGLIDD